MKKLEFETSKGKFLLVDLPNDVVGVKDDGYVLFCSDSEYTPYYDIKSKHSFLLKKITESIAEKIVDSLQRGGLLCEIITGIKNSNIEIYKHDGRDIKFLTAKNCLYSLLKSKGVHLFENPVEQPLIEYYLEDDFFHTITKENSKKFDEDTKKWKEAEQKTFYNPYIFKI